MSACLTRVAGASLVSLASSVGNPSSAGFAAYFLAASVRPCIITPCHSRDWCFHVHVWTAYATAHRAANTIAITITSRSPDRNTTLWLITGSDASTATRAAVSRIQVMIHPMT